MDINFSNKIPLPSVPTSAIRSRGSVFEFGALLVIIGLFFWFILSPKQATLSGLRTQIDTLNNRSDVLSGQQGKFESLVRQLDLSSQEIVRLDEALPLHTRSTWVYLLVENMIQSSGMTVGGLSVSGNDAVPVAGDRLLMADPYIAKRSLQKMTVNLSVTGTFPQFQAFLSKMESSGRVMDIRTLDITSSIDNLLDFRFSFDTYNFGPVAN